MFGALVLGTLALGQASTVKFTPVAATATIALEVSAQMRAGASFGVAATIALGATAPLSAPGPLVGDAAMAVASTAPLALFGPLFGAAGVRVSIADVAVIVAGPLLGDVSVPVKVGKTYTGEVLTDSPTHGWRLDETSGTVANDFVGTAHGTISGGVTVNQPGALADANTAMTFDGTTGKIVTTANVPIPLAVTVEGWIRLTDISDYRPFFSTRNPVDVAGSFVLAVNLTGRLLAYGEGLLLNATRVVSDGVWHHVVYVFTGTTLSFYVDGVLDSTVAWTHSAFAGQPVSIGWDAGAGVGHPLFWLGSLDDIWIYPTALSPARVLAHYNARTATGGTNLAVGGLPLAVDATVSLIAQPRLSNLPATFTATGRVSWITAANLFHTGAGANDVVIAINGGVTANVRVGSIRIGDELNEAPNTCDFIVDLVTPPPVGSNVLIGLGNFNILNILFAGEVIRSTQVFLGKPSQPSWAINCRDYTFLINRRKVWKKYIDTSATAVAIDLIQTFTSGFSTGGIVAGLPLITVQFDGVEVMAALSQIATLVGGYCDVSPAKVVNLFITPPTGSGVPDPITGLGSTFKLNPPIGIKRDLSQVRTVVKVKGRSQNVTGTSGMAHAAGSDLLPINDATPFGSSSGQAITDDVQILSYGSTSPGGLSAKVGSTSGPPAGSVTPALAPSVVGGLVGTYWWALAFANETGETHLGDPSMPLVVPDRGAPVSTIGLGAASQVGPLIGRYGYRTTFITTRGETLPGPIVQRDAVARVVSQVPDVVDSGTGPLLPGAFYQYAVSFVAKWGEALTSSARRNYQPFGHTAGNFASTPLFYPFGGAIGGPYFVTTSIVTALGESLLYNQINMGSSFASAPEAPLFTGSQNTNGRIETGPTYYWACTAYHETFGETTLSGSTMTNTFGVGSLQVQIRMPPLPSNATGLRLYRQMYPVGGVPLPWKLVGEFKNPPTGYWYYWDGLATEDLGGQYPIQTKRAGVRCGYVLNSSPEPGVIARRIYRTKAGGAEYFLVGEIQNNFNGSGLVEALTDDQLVQRATAVATTGRSCLLTNIPQGPPGTTARRLYRTKAGGGALYLAAEIKDNTSTSWLDSTPDNALTVAAPGIATLGDAHQLSSIPLGPAGTLARVIYRTKSWGTEYFRVGRISDNASTTFLDDVTDNELGDGVPLTSTAGAGAVQLSNIAIGPTGVTKRVLYRTAAGGSPVNGFRYLATLDNNTATTFLDDRADTDLGRPPDPESNLGAFTGDTALVLDKVTGFPSSGWIRVGNQFISYTGIVGTTLVGIPPLRPVTSLQRSGTTAILVTPVGYAWQTGDRIMVLGADQSEYNGVRKIVVINPQVVQYQVEGLPVSPATGSISVAPHGAITATIPGASIATTLALLRGVTGLIRAIDVGKNVALWVVRQSAAGIAQLAALEGGDGIREYGITDDSLDSLFACQRRGDADLLMFQYAQITVTYRSQDTKTRSGKTVHIALPPPQNLTGDFLIQSVQMSNIDVASRSAPFFDVTASNARFSLEDLLRHVVLDMA